MIRIWATLSLAALVIAPCLAQSFEFNEEICQNGRMYMVTDIGSIRVKTDMRICCPDFQMIDDVCHVIRRPLSESRFLAAIGLLLVLCCAVALLSMLVAYLMFYRKSHDRYINPERMTLAEDLDDFPSKP